jgi:hypothetical protein
MLLAVCGVPNGPVDGPDGTTPDDVYSSDPCSSYRSCLASSGVDYNDGPDAVLQEASDAAACGN